MKNNLIEKLSELCFGIVPQLSAERKKIIRGLILSLRHEGVVIIHILYH